jgi:4-hydroxythreonine-4-phosphate dehydrogenase
VGDVAAIEAVWKGPIAVIGEPSDAFDYFDRALPVIRVAGDGAVPGRPTLEGARNALDSLEFAVGLTRGGAAAAVVTGPVSKQQLYAIGFSHPGQTEFVAERCGVAADSVAMMLAGPTLRVVPVTGHVPFGGVLGQLTVERIVAKGRHPRPAAPVRHRLPASRGRRPQPACG